jgi:hypothetical protein
METQRHRQRLRVQPEPAMVGVFYASMLYIASPALA